MDCLNCGCNQFIIELDDREKPFLGSPEDFTEDPPYIIDIICAFCGDSFFKFCGESIQEAYARYINQNHRLSRWFALCL